MVGGFTMMKLRWDMQTGINFLLIDYGYLMD